MLTFRKDLAGYISNLCYQRTVQTRRQKYGQTCERLLQPRFVSHECLILQLVLLPLSEPHIVFGRDKVIAVPSPRGSTFFFSRGVIGLARLVTSPSTINSVIREDLDMQAQSRYDQVTSNTPFPFVSSEISRQDIY